MPSNIQKIKYNQELIKNKLKLEKELKFVNHLIEEEQNSCNHVRVLLGWAGSHPYRDTIKEMCLFCGEKFLDTYLPTIDAINYQQFKYSHGERESSRLQKLDDIRNLWIKYQTENPKLTEEEIIEKINHIIKEEIEVANQFAQKKKGLRI